MYEGQVLDNGDKKDADNNHTGSIVVVVPPGGKVRWKKLKDAADELAKPPKTV
jgi:hypothetical protein